MACLKSKRIRKDFTFSQADKLLPQLLNINHRLAAALQYAGKVLRGNSDRTLHELRNIVASQELAVMVGICTWQFKGLGAVPGFIDMGKKGAREVSVIPAATEDYPTAVARPRVITLGVARVDFRHGPYLTGLQVERPDVGIVVPDVEITVFPYCKEQMTPVGRYTWKGCTMVFCNGIIYQFTRTKLMG